MDSESESLHPAKWQRTYGNQGIGCDNVVEDFEDERYENYKQLRIPCYLRDYVYGRLQGLVGRKSQRLVWTKPDHATAERPRVAKALLIDNEMEYDGNRWNPGDRRRARSAEMHGRQGEGRALAIRKLLRRRSADVSIEASTRIPAKPRAPRAPRPPRAPRTRALVHECLHGLLRRNPDHSKLTSSSHTPRLLQLCIRPMGLKPLVRGVPIVVVWEQRQIGFWEALVTLLAQSLVTVANNHRRVQRGSTS
ncbi:hypothetical protein Hte_005856 [Hypoxylon texense]